MQKKTRETECYVVHSNIHKRAAFSRETLQSNPGDILFSLHAGRGWVKPCFLNHLLGLAGFSSDNNQKCLYGEPEVSARKASRLATPPFGLSSASRETTAPPRDVEPLPLPGWPTSGRRDMRRGYLYTYSSINLEITLDRYVWGPEIHQEAQQTRDGSGSPAERVWGGEELRGPGGEQWDFFFECLFLAKLICFITPRDRGIPARRSSPFLSV